MLTKNDLLVLGLLLDRPMHGYELSQYLKAEGVTAWYDVSTAAIYYSLNKLRERGLVSETRSRGDGADKSVYHLTRLGREEFFAGMESALTSHEPLHNEYDLGIFLLNKLPHDKALVLLEQRLDFLRSQSAELEQALERERAAGDQPLRAAILEHSVACARMETEWLSGIIRHLRGEDTEVYRGLMVLTGDLRDFHLPDLIKLIVSGKHSGTLTVGDETTTRSLAFSEGRPVCATSLRPGGEVLEPEMIMDDIYDLFRWQEGAFTFDQRVGAQEGCLVLRISAEDLILAGSRWVDNWATIQRAVPSADAVFERRRSASGPIDLNLTDEEQLVLETIDGLKEVSTVSRECGLTEFETSKILYGLHEVGLVQPGDLDKIRLRRVFREMAELMCRGTVPYRTSPDDVACEVEVNERCGDLPVRLIAGRIEDLTDPGLSTEELAHVYQHFLEEQRDVVRLRFGKDVADELLEQVSAQINPGLRDALKRYSLV
jgi:DNA-binding PadR family transcriptional regulator